MVLWGKSKEYIMVNQDSEDQLTKHLIENGDEAQEDFITSDIPWNQRLVIWVIYREKEREIQHHIKCEM